MKTFPTYPYICPNCATPLSLQGQSYVCANRHCFDVAKSGYVNLILANQKNSADPGDNKEMIDARVKVMAKGYYAPLADEIISLLLPFAPKNIIDAGCGIGYIPYRLNLAFPSAQILGADISRSAVAYASKAYKDIPFAVASSNRLPVLSSSLDALICAFAPVFCEEFARVLRPNGLFIRVIPDVYHLFKLKSALYTTPYLNELDPEELSGFTLIKKSSVRYELTFTGEELESLVKMTPYYYHTRIEDIEKLCQLPELTVNLAFEVRQYQKNL